MSKFTAEINSTLAIAGFDPYKDPHLYWLGDICDPGFMIEYYTLENNDHSYTVAVVCKARIMDALILESLGHIRQRINDSVPLSAHISINIAASSVTYTDSRSQDMIFTDGRLYQKFGTENFYIYLVQV